MNNKQKALIAASGMALAGGIAWRYASRPRDIRWIDYAGEMHQATTSNFAVVDGVRLHFQERGARNNETIVLLHGFASSNYTWKDCFAPLVEAGYHVIAPDLKGFGFSEKPADNRYHIQDQAHLIIGLLDHLGVERAVFCGNSYGGGTSLACALMHPQRVRGLILVDAAFNDVPITQKPYGLSLLLARTWGLGEVGAPLLLGSKAFIRNGLRGMFHDKSAVTEERVRAYHRPLRSSNCQQAILAASRQWDLNWIESELGDVHVPTLVLWGEFDPVIPLTQGARLHLSVPNSEFIVIPECGHLPQEEQPETTAEIMIDFCRRTKPTGSGSRRTKSAGRKKTVAVDSNE
ncbi:MAG: alpha/beta hydrolase [Blastocatellia bacterium]|nr:alpha/beta hydrolase [Blastocatellia bacterium]